MDMQSPAVKSTTSDVISWVASICNFCVIIVDDVAILVLGYDQLGLYILFL